MTTKERIQVHHDAHFETALLSEKRVLEAHEKLKGGVSAPRARSLAETIDAHERLFREEMCSVRAYARALACIDEEEKRKEKTTA